MKGAKQLGEIIKRSAKKNAHEMTANLVRQFIERSELDEIEEGEEIEALEEIRRYHERMASK